MKSNLSEFCEQHGIPESIKAAFGTYLRTIYAKKFLLSDNGETVHLLIGRMTTEELETAWQEYVRELANWLTR